MNNFSSDLEYANIDREEFWLPRYKKAFPTMIGTIPLPMDCAGQRMGIDRIIQLSSGQTLRIDEKIRRKCYPDILIEYVSNDKTKAPGWIEKDLAIDFIAYACEEDGGRTYMLPWLLLKRCWGNYKEEWIEKYGEVIAKNDGYNTISVPVNKGVLLEAMRVAMIIAPTQKATQ